MYPELPESPELEAKLRKMAELTGRCVSMWGHIEHSLASLLCGLLPTDWNTGCAIFSNINNFSIRLDIVDSIARLRLKNTPELAFWNSLKEYMSELSGDRNNIAHSPSSIAFDPLIGNIPDPETAIPQIGPCPILHTSDKAKRAIHIEELEELRKDFKECVDLLRGFTSHVVGKHDPQFRKRIQRRRPPRNKRLQRNPPRPLRQL